MKMKVMEKEKIIKISNFSKNGYQIRIQRKDLHILAWVKLFFDHFLKNFKFSQVKR